MQNKLLLSRAAFGISLEQFKNPVPVSKLVNSLFPTEPPEALTVVSREAYNDLDSEVQGMDPKQKMAAKKAFRGPKTLQLNQLWMDQMIEGPYPLLEKMSIFWHGHFATKLGNPFFVQLLITDIRNNALGNFGELFRKVSKSPAMLFFLNSRQNRKKHPNENFAREVMELFTLGRGNYTEQDITEAARAFTGWSYNAQGEFVYKDEWHDEGEKSFLGRKGNFTGDDILDILLEQKQTAIFLTRKIYTYFVSDEAANEERIQQLADGFYKSHYDIAGLLKNIFNAPWFYSDEIVGAKVKAPVELLVGYQRTVPVEFRKERATVALQRTLGQLLFYPPNVAGWKGGKNWIDSSSLVIRMSLPDALYADKELDLTVKEIDAEMDDPVKTPVLDDAHADEHFTVGGVQANWEPYITFWKGYDQEELPAKIASFLINLPLSEEKINEVKKFADKDSPAEYIKSLTILFMKLPEYQLS